MFQVQATTGANSGFLFPAIGMPLGDPTSASGTYGGVAIGYSATAVRVFLPTEPQGSLVNVPSAWGAGNMEQHSATATLVLSLVASQGG